MDKKGKVYIVGLGPGGRQQMTRRALEAIGDSQVILGYKVYTNLIEDLAEGKKVLASSMGRELERCKMAIDLAREGHNVSLVSSGDPGIYGMAGPFLELNSKETEPVEAEIIPGITAASTGAALLGAPLMHDMAIISLSDLLTPWEVIVKRLNLAAQGDFVTALYNPKSHGRPDYINQAREIFLEHRNPRTPVGIVRNAAREGEEITVTNLDEMLSHEMDMFSVVIIGNSRSYIQAGKFITPRGYVL